MYRSTICESRLFCRPTLRERRENNAELLQRHLNRKRQLAAYWQKSSIGPNEQVMVGVSFPASSMPNYTPPIQRGRI